jgi:hypothetical protein
MAMINGPLPMVKEKKRKVYIVLVQERKKGTTMHQQRNPNLYLVRLFPQF